MIAILTATEFELPQIRNRLSKIKDPYLPTWIGSLFNQTIIHAIHGMGKQINFPLWMNQYPIKLILLVGFSGGLSPHLDSNRTYWINECIRCNQPPIKTHNQFYNINSLIQSLTISFVATTPFEKRLLLKQTKANLIDMETYFIAKISEQKSIHFLSLRAISDTWEETLPCFLANICQNNGYLSIKGILNNFINILKHADQIFQIKNKSDSSNLLLWNELTLFLKKLDKISLF